VFQVIQSYDWKVMQNSLDIHMLGVLSNAEGDIIDHHEYKKACLLIAQKLEVCNLNSELARTCLIYLTLTM